MRSEARPISIKAAISVSVGVLALLALCIPVRDVVVVPRWRVQIVTADFRPLSDEQVAQAWLEYSMEFWRLGEHVDHRSTDSEGFVEFPERRIRVSALEIALSNLRDLIASVNPHASYGTFAYIYCEHKLGCRAFYDGSGEVLDKIVVEN